MPRLADRLAPGLEWLRGAQAGAKAPPKASPETARKGPSPAEPRPPTRFIDCDGMRLPVEIRRHPTAKRMILRLADDGASARVTIPRWGRVGEALRFAQDRASWLAAQRARRPERECPAPGGTLWLRGAALTIDWAPDRPRGPRALEGVVQLGGPQDTIAPRLRRWLQQQAREVLAQDLAFYAARAGLPPAPLALSNARRRWGSCAPDGAIRINWRLIQAPDAVRRSVVAHEIAHRLHFDHSPRFHAALRTLFDDDLDAAERWLKARGRTLYAAFD